MRAQEADAFKLEMGDFALLDEVAADVAQTKQHWDRYAEFLKERNEMANRDWLSMRDQARVLPEGMGRARTHHGRQRGKASSELC